MPSLVRRGFVAFASGIVPLLVYAWGVRGPSARDAEQKEATLSRRVEELRALEVTRDRLPELQRESAVLDGKLAVLDQIRPAAPRPELFPERLRGICREQGLDLLEAKALPLAGEEAPFDVRVKGTRAAFVAFLARLPRSARLNRVDRIQMSRAEREEIELAVRLVAFHARDGGG